MSILKIYIDKNFPKRLVEALCKIHDLQKVKEYELIHDSFTNINKEDTENAIFLLMDFKSRGLEITTLKHYEGGLRVIACKTGEVEKIDRFEFSMTVLRVWPFIIEKQNKFILLFSSPSNMVAIDYPKTKSTKTNPYSKKQHNNFKSYWLKSTSIIAHGNHHGL